MQLPGLSPTGRICLAVGKTETPKEKKSKKEKKDKTPAKEAKDEAAAAPESGKLGLAKIAKPMADDKLSKKVRAAAVCGARGRAAALCRARACSWLARAPTGVASLLFFSLRCSSSPRRRPSGSRSSAA
jgi:hypothetical protein